MISLARTKNHIFKRRRHIGFLAFSVMAHDTMAFSAGHSSSTCFPYEPPSWAEAMFANVPPNGRLKLGNFPTPLYKVTGVSERKYEDDDTSSSILGRLEELKIRLYIKRDDMSGGVETGGNKIRKLEFLLADAIARDYDSVVTIGGEQSNHCRATAAASRMVRLEPHLILRTRKADAIQEQDGDIGYTGNILFDRMVGSSIYTCTPGEYGRIGSTALVKGLCDYLKQKNKDCKPYAIPVGGSNGIGTWGYINGVEEFLSQWNTIEEEESLDHLIFACGSGGTAAGIALGVACAFKNEATKPEVHAIGVCDSPDYFYGHVSEIAEEMGFQAPNGSSSIESFVRESMIVHQGKGLGYATSTPEELQFIKKFAIETGIVLDPVYSGKALFNFLKPILETDEAELYRGKSILFWHTGGALGLFENGNDIDFQSAAKRLDVYGKGFDNGVDISMSKSKR